PPTLYAQAAGAVSVIETARSLRKLARSIHPAALPACQAAQASWSRSGVVGSLRARQFPLAQRISSVSFSTLLPARYSSSDAMRTRRRHVRAVVSVAPSVGSGVPRNARAV